MNVIHLIGNIGRKIELKTVGSTIVGKFSLATSSTYTNKAGEKVTETQWHDIEVWGKTAEVLERFTDKGHKLQVSGELRYDKYTNNAGTEVTRAKVRLTEFTFLQPREGGTSGPTNAEKSQVGKDEDNYDWTQDDALGF
jgi:single-strand DNA-binding protein